VTGESRHSVPRLRARPRAAGRSCHRRARGRPGDVGVYGRQRLFGGEARVAAQSRKSHGVVFHEISSSPWRVQNCDNWIAPTSHSGGAPSSSSRCAHWATSVARPVRSSGKPAGEFGYRHLEPVLQRGGDRLRGAARREACASRGAPILVAPLGRRRDSPLIGSPPMACRCICDRTHDGARRRSRAAMHR
jgi:hypothetical protein